MKKLNNVTQEEWFLFWCDDAIKAGYIKKVITDIKPLVVYPGLKANKIEKKILYKGTKKEREKINIKKKIILESVTYKPDAIIVWEEKALNVLFTPMDLSTTELPWRTAYFYAQLSHKNGPYLSPVEVKAPPGYGNTNSSDASFRILQKWIYKSKQIFINKVRNHPNAFIKNKDKSFKRFKSSEPYLWMETFTPSRYFMTDKLTKARTISNWKPRTIKEFEDELLPKNRN